MTLSTCAAIWLLIPALLLAALSVYVGANAASRAFTQLSLRFRGWRIPFAELWSPLGRIVTSAAVLVLLSLAVSQLRITPCAKALAALESDKQLADCGCE